MPAPKGKKPMANKVEIRRTKRSSVASMRRPHTKSRRGCRQCKDKHTKCDETRPVCGRCVKLELDCSYQSPQPGVAVPGTHESSASPLSYAMSSSIYHLPLTEIELVHHFLGDPNVTPVLESNELRRLIKVEYMRVGLTSPFLLHTILAISALHIFAEDGHRIEMFNTATFHAQEGLSQGRDVIGKLGQENAIAAFMFSGLTANYAFGERAIAFRDITYEDDVIKDLLNCFQLARGIVSIVMRHHEFLTNSFVEPLIRNRGDFNNVRLDLQSLYPHMVDLQNDVELLPSEDQKRACRGALINVFNFLGLVQEVDDTFRGLRLMHTWSMLLDEEFMRMLELRNPFALVILAHYAVLMHLRTDTWWLDGWGRMLLQHIEQILSPEWQARIAWPKQMVFANPVPAIEDMSV